MLNSIGSMFSIDTLVCDYFTVIKRHFLSSNILYETTDYSYIEFIVNRAGHV